MVGIIASQLYSYSMRQTMATKKTLAANNSKLFAKPDHVKNSLYEVELANAQIQHKGPIIVGFFILQDAKFRMLELY